MSTDGRRVMRRDEERRRRGEERRPGRDRTIYQKVRSDQSEAQSERERVWEAARRYLTSKSDRRIFRGLDRFYTQEIYDVADERMRSTTDWYLPLLVVDSVPPPVSWIHPRCEYWDGVYDYGVIVMPRDAITIDYLQVMAIGTPAWWQIRRDEFAETYRMVAIGELVESHGIAISRDMEIRFFNCNVNIQYRERDRTVLRSQQHRS